MSNDERKKQNTLYILSENVRFIRRTKHLTLSSLALRSGITEGYLSRLENQKIKNVQLSTISNLAMALGVRVVDLLNDEWCQEIYTEEEQVKLENLAKADLFFPKDNLTTICKDTYISCLMELVPLLPLIDRSELLDVYLNRFQGSFFNYTNYICDQFSYLICEIKDSDAKEYAMNYMKIIREYRTNRDYNKTAMEIQLLENSKAADSYNEVIQRLFEKESTITNIIEDIKKQIIEESKKKSE